MIIATEDIGVEEQCRQRECCNEAEYYVRGEEVYAFLCMDHTTEIIGDGQVIMVDSEVLA